MALLCCKAFVHIADESLQPQCTSSALQLCLQGKAVIVKQPKQLQVFFCARFHFVEGHRLSPFDRSPDSDQQHKGMQ